MLEVSEAETSGTTDDEVENRPAKAEAAGLAGEAANDLGPSLDLAQRPLEQVGAANLFAKTKRIVQMDAQRRQVSGQTRRSPRILGLQLTHQAAPRWSAATFSTMPPTCRRWVSRRSGWDGRWSSAFRRMGMCDLV